MRAVLAAAGIAALTACTSVRTAPHSSTPAPSSASPSTPQARLSAGLLAASDVSGYRHTTITDTSQSRLPCTAKQPPLVSQYPPEVSAQAAFSSATTQSAFREVLYGYSTVSDTEAAYAAVQDGFNCTTGSLDGSSVRIARVGSVQQGRYRGERWDFTLADGTLGSVVVGQVGTTLVQINFVATQAGSSEADPGSVLQKALAKVAAAMPG